MPASWATDWSVGDIVTKAEFRKSMGCVADSTLAIATASFDFTGLPTTYAHLMVVLTARGDNASTSVSVLARFNADTAANYDWQSITGNSTTAAAAQGLAATSIQVGNIPAATATANVFSGLDFEVPAYQGTTGQKSCHGRAGLKQGTTATDLVSYLVAGYWRSTVAVSRITLLPSAGNFAAGSRCSIYVMGS